MFWNTPYLLCSLQYYKVPKNLEGLPVQKHCGTRNMLGVMIIILYLLEASTASEPQCSSFHYEEKTLEKMIKLEIFVQKIKNDIDDIEKRVTDTLRKVENEREGLKVDIRTAIDKTKEELKENKRTIISEFQRELNALKNITGSVIKPNVAFSVKTPADLKLTVGETIIYGDLTLNEGRGYDKTTGIFTAPASGTYIFSIQLCSTKADGIGYAVMSKERELKRGWLKDNDDDNCHSAEAVDILSKGDRVWIKCIESSILLDNEYRSNTFSGVLVHML